MNKSGLSGSAGQSPTFEFRYRWSFHWWSHSAINGHGSNNV